MLGIAPVTGAGQKAEERTGPPKKGVAGERISAAGEPSPEYVCVSVIRKSTKRYSVITLRYFNLQRVFINI